MLTFCVILLITSASCNDVNYYVNLIEKETKRAFTNNLPQDSSAFQASGNLTDYGTFDYIVVGAGSAGAVVASRLSEIQNNRVLLLEAGGRESNFSDIPLMMHHLQGLEFNWNYVTTPQTTSCLGMLNKQCPHTRGRGLGGSSIINALIYGRGNKRDFDNWHDQGNPGWSYKDVLYYFKKSENSRIDGDPGYHGKGGYLNVEYFKPYSPQFKAFVQANLELGRKVLDYNGEEQLGVSGTQLNNINGRRQSTGKAFLQPAMDRANLKIQIDSLVTKILIHPSNNTAYAITFSHEGTNFMAKARKEIILSAGSFGSPQLLILSGIGPKQHLNQLGIPMVKLLGVGDNLQDHATYYSLNFITNYTEPAKTLEENVENYLNSFGAFTIGGNSQGLGFYQTKLAKIPGYPDIELIIVPSNNTNNKIVQKVGNYNDDSYRTVWEKVDPQRTFTMFVILLHPKSRGTVRLKSASPYDYPLINPRFLSDPEGEDIETLHQGIQLALEIVNTKAFQKLNTTLMYAPLPACSQHEYLSRAYWYCQLRQLTYHLYHPVGTCKMGPDPLTGAVVDHELKVHGVGNLRVADASIVPEAPSGHINAVAIMIGEKVADIIKNNSKYHHIAVT